MAVKHDPGPDGPSGEGEFVLFCIFSSYILSSYSIITSYLTKRNEQYYVTDNVTDNVEENNNDVNHDSDNNVVDVWINDTTYIPSDEYRQKFIKYVSLGFITTGNYDDISENTKSFRFFYFLSSLHWMKIVLFFFVFGLLWLFLVCLGLMGTGFKLVGGKDAAKMFDIVDNPISSLMVGILTTVLVQSSSTTTSLIVGLVGANEMTVNTAIPMIMGANIGTSVTNTLVSLSHFNNVNELRLGFAAATIHDCFNLLTVLILLPIQIVTHIFNHLTYELSKNIDACNEEEYTCDKQEFIKPYIKPYYNDIAQYDKKVASYVSQGYCEGKCNDDSVLSYRQIATNLVCKNKHCDSVDEFKTSWLDHENTLKKERLPKYIEFFDINNITTYMYNCPMFYNCTDLQYLKDIIQINNITRNDMLIVLLQSNYSGSLIGVCDDMSYGLCDKQLLKGVFSIVIGIFRIIQQECCPYVYHCQEYVRCYT